MPAATDGAADGAGAELADGLGLGDAAGLGAGLGAGLALGLGEGDVPATGDAQGDGAGASPVAAAVPPWRKRATNARTDRPPTARFMPAADGSRAAPSARPGRGRR